METSRERVTRADVAKAAGVSETIVSYVVNNNRYVAKEKRQRVEEAIRALNYRPNNMARALKGKKSNQILFIADHITNEYFSSIVSAMDQYAYEAGYLISLCANRNTPEFVSQVISRQYDGIVISSASFPEEYVSQFIQAGISQKASFKTHGACGSYGDGPVYRRQKGSPPPYGKGLQKHCLCGSNQCQRPCEPGR